MEGENAAVVGRRLVGGLFLENRLHAVGVSVERLGPAGVVDQVVRRFEPRGDGDAVGHRAGGQPRTVARRVTESVACASGGTPRRVSSTFFAVAVSPAL